LKIGSIYARSSLDSTRVGDTVEHQVQMIQEFAKRSDIEVKFSDEFIYEEDGESAYKTTLLQRPSMKRMMDDIDAGIVEIVFFKGISRFARDSGEAINTAKKLRNKGVRVVSLEENYDSIRDDPTMFQIYAVMAEQESRKTSIRVSLNNKQKARNGLWANSTLPLGYSKVKDVENEELKSNLLSEGKHPNSLYPNENKFIVQKVFEMYVKEDMGRKKIASWLNSKGYKTQRNNEFSEKIVKDILLNHAYVGDIVYGKKRYEYVEHDVLPKKIQKTIFIGDDDWAIKKDSHPGIIEKDVFMEAQTKFKNNEGRFNKKKKFNAAKHPLTGILKCNKCGKPMICQKRVNKKKDGTKLEYRYYVCSTYHQKGRNVCDQANVNADKLERRIYDFMENELKQLNKEKVLSKLKNKDHQNKQIKDELKIIEVNIQKKVKASANLLENIDMYDRETFRELNTGFKKEIASLRKNKEDLEKQLKNAGTEKNGLDFKKLLEKFTQLNLGNIGDTREVFHELIDEIDIEDKIIKRLKTRY
jgi:site-specific DNA recombinase